MPERLHRLEHHFARHPIWFVTACTHARAPILANASSHSAIEEFAKNGPHHGAWLGAYVLMPDHLHAFVTLDDERLILSAWIKSLKGTLSKAFRATGIASPYWQKGTFDHVLRSSESYTQKWHYVRDNPVRADLATDWESWPYQGQPHPLSFD